jgi:hypothetical protein
MKFHGKAEVNEVLRKHNHGAIESDKVGKSYGSNVPYRTWDGKIVKGIMLFRTSSVTFTSAGREQGKRIVDRLLDDLRELGAVKRLSEFGFVASVPVSSKKGLVIKGEIQSKEGLEYDQTFHYLDVNISEVATKDFNLNNFDRYEDKPTEQHELSNAYLDYVLRK